MADPNDSASTPEDAVESGSRPVWWERNEELRRELGLPEYDPPRFEDGVYKHDVQTAIEDRLDCSIGVRSKNPQQYCEWDVHVDGEHAFSMDRRRTENGNTVFQMTSEEFVEAVSAHAT